MNHWKLFFATPYIETRKISWVEESILIVKSMIDHLALENRCPLTEWDFAWFHFVVVCLMISWLHNVSWFGVQETKCCSQERRQHIVNECWFILNVLHIHPCCGFWRHVNLQMKLSCHISKTRSFSGNAGFHSLI